jgi:hypothetical protein
MSTLEYFKTKYNLPEKGEPIEIPNVGRIDIIRWIKELGLKRGAEIGVDHAELSREICEYNNQVKLYGIDPYLKYDEYREYESQKQMDGIYEWAQEVMADHVAKGRYEFIREKSEDAVKRFKDGELDFVYIDANHEEDYPLRDIEMWAPKVRKGGLVMGHDYVRIKVLKFTIKDALEKYTKEHNINPWFVLGTYMVRPREIRDNSRSWMFIR